MNKKILIIGGNGFIGSNLAKLLACKEGIDTFSFDLSRPKSQVVNVHYMVGDFFDDHVLKCAVSGMDIVIHALSTVNPGNSNVKFMQGYGRDLLQTVKLCSMIIEQNTNMIFLSSGGTVYGVQDMQPIQETALPVPINHYGTVKLCIENVIRTFNTQLHTKMRIARISNPYGPGQDYNKGVGFVDATLKKAILGEVLEIWGDGENVRDYIYIDDVCNMLYELIEYTGTEEVFNLSSNEGVSQNQVVALVKEIHPGVKVQYKNKRSVDVRKIVLDNAKIKSLYKQDILEFNVGIRKYYNYLCEQNENDNE